MIFIAISLFTAVTTLILILQELHSTDRAY